MDWASTLRPGFAQDNTNLTRNRCLLAVGFALTVLSFGSSAGEIFKCRNADGQLGYQSVSCDRGDKTVGRWKTAEEPVAAKNEASRRVGGARSVAISLSPDGAYYVMGTVNGVETRFQIDTGASTVSIPSQFGRRVGMSCKAEGISNTANGVTKTCHADAKRLTFGPFTLEDFPVTMLPNLDVPLIGMNALRQLRMEQRDDVLTLSF